MIDYLQKLKEFHTKYSHYTGVRGVQIPREVLTLRKRLIAEEAREFLDACDGMDFALANDEPDMYQQNYILAADALADLLYVTFGASLALDVPIEPVFLEIHDSNMTKSTGKDQHGKTIKGPAYRPPQIQKILEKMK